jgi:ubiquitin carboxyl-terminal hydrolase 4/11/15
MSRKKAKPPPPRRYDLFAISNHIGGLNGGHYTAHCLKATPQGSKQWFHFNDTRVNEVPESSLPEDGGLPYVLFYKRRDT